MVDIASQIIKWAPLKPDIPAIVDKTETIDYAGLRDRILQRVRTAQRLGLEGGEIVLMFCRQEAAAIADYIGLMMAGAVPSFMPLPSVKQSHDRYWASHTKLLELIRPAVVVCPPEFIAGLERAGLSAYTRRIISTDEFRAAPPEDDGWSPPVIGEGAIALLQHSSGTTALKKGVALSHQAVAAQIASYARRCRSTPADIVATWLPMYHDMGLIACTIAPLVLGQTIVLLDPFEWVARPRILFDAITRHRATLCWLPNFAFELLAKAVPPDPLAHDLSSIRAFINCSEPCKPATFDRFAALFAPIGVTPDRLHVSYAMAETVFAVTQTEPGSTVRVLAVNPVRLAADKAVAPPAGKPLELLSNGSPIEGVTVTIATEDGKALPADHVGEIEIESTFLFDGYYKRDQLTGQRFRNGRYRTGDVGFCHDGELYVLGRTDDLIIVHGRNYFAHEIEALANEVGGLKPGRNVAIGVPNEALGSLEIVLIAEALPEVDIVQLKRDVKLAVSDTMNLGLRDLVIVPPGWLVKSTSGKISRSANLDKYLAERTQKVQPRGITS